MLKIKTSQAGLKNLAMALMFINHFGYIYCQAFGIEGFWYDFCWFISRPAFVIYAFFIAEGLRRTHSRKNYLIRLGIFALLSEIPFDLCFSNQVVDLEHNNVFITLFLGALAITIMDKTEFKGEKIAICALACIAADFIMSDYGAMGVGIILCFYLLQDNPKAMYLSIAAVMIGYLTLGYLDYLILDFSEYFLGFLKVVLQQLHGCLAFPLFSMYKGDKGKPLPKLVYYTFYPVHLLLIWVLLVR